jgi:hypothetical protein
MVAPAMLKARMTYPSSITDTLEPFIVYLKAPQLCYCQEIMSPAGQVPALSRKLAGNAQKGKVGRLQP